jgi:FkbM family methyltransferase
MTTPQEIITMKIRSAIRRIINTLGYDIRRFAPSNTTSNARIRTTIGESYALIRGLGFQPKTIIDVGVASGTPDLYRTFPDCYFLLIEPLKEFESDLIAILKKYNGSYVLAAAGPRSGQATLNVHKTSLDGSSLRKETMGTEADGYEISVPLIKIDDILKEKQLDGPYLLKVDVQGAELSALDGALQALLETEVVVLEVSLFEFMVGAPQFYEVISYMKERDFVAYDIIHVLNRPLDNALGQVDVVFVKDKGMFRRDHSYSTVEQMKAKFGS